MTGGVHHRELDIANVERLAVGELTFRRGRLLERDAVDLSLPRGCFVKPSVKRMEIDRNVPPSLYRRNRTDVVNVRVSNPDRLERRRGIVDCLYESISLTARIHYDRAVSAVIHQQIAVLLERADGEGLDYHR